MATPITGHNISTTDDAYNFYHLQIRITIEQAFGILVHRWGILRRPMSMSIKKVPSLVMCLMKLHNFCINNNGCSTKSTYDRDERFIRRSAVVNGPRNATAIQLNSRGLSHELLGRGHHFMDMPGQRRTVLIHNEHTPMHGMRTMVAEKSLQRPAVNKYARKCKH